jgi:hypothetical protein
MELVLFGGRGRGVKKSYRTAVGKVVSKWEDVRARKVDTA